MTTTTLPTLNRALAQQIEEHVFAETTHEVGGILVGHLNGDVATIEAAIPALRATEAATNVTFTHQVWADVHDTLERDHPGRRIVGWYHSHPGFGLFLSGYDTFIQSNFFAEPGMLALVVDPLAGEQGWFDWHDGQIRELGRGATLRPAIPRGSDLRQAATARRMGAGRMILGSLVLAGLAGIGGYAYGALSAPVVTATGSANAPNNAVPAAPTDTSALADQLQAANKRITELESDHDVSIYYTVRPGDSWWRISHQLTGQAVNYQTLQHANPHVHGLNPGDVIIVPGVPAAPNSPDAAKP